MRIILNSDPIRLEDSAGCPGESTGNPPGSRCRQVTDKQRLILPLPMVELRKTRRQQRHRCA